MLHFICPLYGHTTFLCYNSLYDWRNGNDKYTILTTGHYILLITLLITLYTLASNFIVATNKFLQTMLNVFNSSFLLLQVQYKCLCCTGLSVYTAQSKTFQDCPCHGRCCWPCTFQLYPCSIYSIQNI